MKWTKYRCFILHEIFIGGSVDVARDRGSSLSINSRAQVRKIDRIAQHGRSLLVRDESGDSQREAIICTNKLKGFTVCSETEKESDNAVNDIDGSMPSTPQIIERPSVGNISSDGNIRDGRHRLERKSVCGC